MSFGYNVMKSNKQHDISFLVRMTLFKRFELLTTSFFFIEASRVTLACNILFWHILINLVAVKWSSWPWESQFIFKWVYLGCIKIQPQMGSNQKVKDKIKYILMKIEKKFILSHLSESILCEEIGILFYSAFWVLFCFYAISLCIELGVEICGLR